MRSRANGSAFFIYIIICRICGFRGLNGELSGRWKVSLPLERTHMVRPYGVCENIVC